MLKATKSSTRILILATAIIWIAYDIFAAYTGGGEVTESWNLYEMVARYPSLGVAIGILIGHLFFSQSRIRIVNPSEIAIPPE